jgi:putative flavoprotein involved in K+ transport
VRDLGCDVFATGFRPAYDAWLPWPAAFDELGFPIHEDGESTVVPGLFFVGVHFLRTRKSSLASGRTRRSSPSGLRDGSACYARCD